METFGVTSPDPVISVVIRSVGKVWFTPQDPPLLGTVPSGDDDEITSYPPREDGLNLVLVQGTFQDPFNIGICTSHRWEVKPSSTQSPNPFTLTDILGVTGQTYGQYSFLLKKGGVYISQTLFFTFFSVSSSTMCCS